MIKYYPPTYYYNAFNPDDSLHSTYDGSTYLIDSGMWTACYESRDTMLRLSRNRHCCPGLTEVNLITKTELGPFARSFRQNCVGYFYGTDTARAGTREKQYFTVLIQDLICIQLPDPTTLIRFEWLYMPFLQPDLQWLDPENPNTKSMVEHLAFEYNPDWNDPRRDVFAVLEQYYVPGDRIPSKTDSMLAQAVRGLRGRATLWFIDHRIKRRRGLSGSRDEDQDQPVRPPVRPDRHVFYGNGCRLVEVGPTDKEWELCLGSGGDERRVPFNDHILHWLVAGWKERDQNPFAFQDALFSAFRPGGHDFWTASTHDKEVMDWVTYQQRGMHMGRAMMGVLAFEKY